MYYFSILGYQNVVSVTVSQPHNMAQEIPLGICSDEVTVLVPPVPNGPSVALHKEILQSCLDSTDIRIVNAS